MTEPPSSSVLKAIAILRANASPNPEFKAPFWGDDFRDGWQQGRKALANEIIEELGIID